MDIMLSILLANCFYRHFVIYSSTSMVKFHQMISKEKRLLPSPNLLILICQCSLSVAAQNADFPLTELQ